jgi:hypothetical protein
MLRKDQNSSDLQANSSGTSGTITAMMVKDGRDNHSRDIRDYRPRSSSIDDADEQISAVEECRRPSGRVLGKLSSSIAQKEETADQASGLGGHDLLGTRRCLWGVFLPQNI